MACRLSRLGGPWMPSPSRRLDGGLAPTARRWPRADGSAVASRRRLGGGLALASRPVTTRPRLSVVGITANSSDRLERWATLAREYADEIALLVDEASDDETLRLARKVADRVQVVEHPPFIEVAMDWGLRAARGEWVLWLDDDELLAPRFPERLDELLDDPDATHYWQADRWVVRRPEGGYGWLATFPWHPNPRLRLIRRVGSVFSHRGRLHSPIDVDGEGRLLEDPDTAIYHLDFVLRDREARERKVARYRGHPAPSCEEYYLWEDYRSTVDIVPLDPAVVEREPSAAARDRAAAATASDAPDEGPPVPLERLQASIARYWPNADVFSASYGSHTTPGRVLANRGYTARLEIHNTSALTWRTTGRETGRVVLSYHWTHPEHGLLLREGDVTLLPGVIRAGDVVTVTAGFWTPYEPGRYRLEWDLHCLGVNWFSERGMPPLIVEIEVEDRGRLLAMPRTVARLPARATRAPANLNAGPRADSGVPAPPPITDSDTSGRRRTVSLQAGLRVARRLAATHLPAPQPPEVPAPAAPPPATPPPAVPAAANLIPIAPVRVLDSRDGTGVPGAPVGPIEAGAVVTLEITGHPHIPDTAVGIVGNLAVPASDFNGFVSVYPAGSGGDGTVGIYFNDRGQPTVNQVVVGLGTGPHGGKVSMHVSDHAGGTVQLLLDLVAYLD
jgi:hypothetical protein